MLKRVHVKGYKSLADVEVTLEPLTVLFGPNAAGKSNFLDALQLLTRLGASRTLKDAFEPPYRGKPIESFRIGGGGIKGLVEQERLGFSIEADLRLSDAVVASVDREIADMRRPSRDTEASGISSPPARGRVRERDLRYRIEIEMLPKSGILRVADEYLAALNRTGEPTGKRKPFVERQGEKIHLRLEGQGRPTHYDRFLDHSVLSLPHYPPHYPHLVAARREMESWRFFYFEPRERMRAANPVKEVRHIGLVGEELAAFLNTVRATAPRQFASIEKALHTLLPERRRHRGRGQRPRRSRVAPPGRGRRDSGARGVRRHVAPPRAAGPDRRRPAARGKIPAAFDGRCIPAELRCSSVEYGQYAPSSRLVSRAPRPSRCDAGFYHGLPGAGPGRLRGTGERRAPAADRDDRGVAEDAGTPAGEPVHRHHAFADPAEPAAETLAVRGPAHERTNRHRRVLHVGTVGTW